MAGDLAGARGGSVMTAYFRDGNVTLYHGDCRDVGAWTGGDVLVQLDDDAAVAGFQIDLLNVADILDKQCSLLVTANVSMSMFTITNTGGDFPVSMPHSLAMHDGGQIAGMSDAEHPVLAAAILSTTIGDGEPMDSELMLDGNLPVFTANIQNGGANGTMAWAAPQALIATTMFSITEPLALDITVDLIGLTGSLTLAP